MERDLLWVDKIICDICGKYSGYNDNREPWERRGALPGWICADCELAIKYAKEQLNVNSNIIIQKSTTSYDSDSVIVEDIDCQFESIITDNKVK